MIKVFKYKGLEQSEIEEISENPIDKRLKELGLIDEQLKRV